jgi:diguanylate cyclase (GGDEF)-like protein
VEVDRPATERFRQELQALAERIGGAETADALRETRITFLGALEDYAGKAGRYVKALQEKVSASSRALAELLEAIRQSQSDERRLQLGLGQLHSIAQDPEIMRLCPEIVNAVGTVEESVENLRKQNQLAVAKLREEVDSLKGALESAREAAAKDPVAGVLNRNGALREIRERLAARRSFCLIYLWASNFDYLHRRYGSQYRDAVVAEFAARLRQKVGDEGVVARWGEEHFAVIVDRPKPEAVWLTESYVQDVGKPFVVRESSLDREVKVLLRTGVVEAVAGATEQRVHKDTDKLLLALETVAAPNM